MIRLTTKNILALVVLFQVMSSSGPITAGSHDDKVAVERAVLDYVQGIYEVDPKLIDRGVRPDLRKIGFWYDKDKGTYQGPREMTFDELRTLAARWNKEGRVDPETAVKEVIIYEVLDETASVKLVAAWGIDYMHLAKFDGEWQIINVLWQSPPRMAPGTTGNLSAN